jgi:ATP-binding cassette subfamily C protein LapB
VGAARGAGRRLRRTDARGQRRPADLRDASQPWHKRAREHWFWSEIAKDRRKFTPVFIATVIINLLALALPLFSMNVYDRVIPNRAESTCGCWRWGCCCRSAGVRAAPRPHRSARRDRPRLDLRLSQKIFAKILAAPLAERKGHTGNLVARVSEYAIVRDFFASTTVVLLIDMVFLVLFVAMIGYIAGWLALVPLVAMG